MSGECGKNGRLYRPRLRDLNANSNLHIAGLSPSPSFRTLPAKPTSVAQVRSEKEQKGRPSQGGENLDFKAMKPDSVGLARQILKRKDYAFATKVMQRFATFGISTLLQQ